MVYITLGITKSTMADLPAPTNSPTVGECIYCGATHDLGKEHAVPYGLNGHWTLLQASCRDCADITHRFERDTMRGMLKPVRVALGMQTRRPTQRPKTLPLVLEVNGERRTIDLSANQYPVYLPTPSFPPPGYVTGAPSQVGVPTDLRFLYLAGPSFEDFIRAQSAEFAGACLNFSPPDFARTLAKIGFASAVFVLGIAALRHSPIRQVILGHDPCVGHWVGSWIGEEVNEPKGLHAIKVRASGADVHVVIRLFAQFAAPEYHVVLGPAAPEFVSSSAWPWK